MPDTPPGSGVDEPDAPLFENVVHLAEAVFYQGQAGIRDERSTGFDRLGVAIESDHSSRPHLEHGARVAARSKRSIDSRFARLDGHCANHLVKEDRHVRRCG